MRVGRPEDAWVIDATEVLKLKTYPEGIRIRAEPLHPGAKANVFDTDGNRITAFLTNFPRFNLVYLDARHRARGRCENCKTLKSTGLNKLPYWSYEANKVGGELGDVRLEPGLWLQLAVLPAGRARGRMLGYEAVALPPVFDGRETGQRCTANHISGPIRCSGSRTAPGFAGPDQGVAAALAPRTRGNLTGCRCNVLLQHESKTPTGSVEPGATTVNQEVQPAHAQQRKTPPEFLQREIQGTSGP